MNAQLRIEIEQDRRQEEERFEPLPPGLEQLPEHQWPSSAKSKRDPRPYYLKD